MTGEPLGRSAGGYRSGQAFGPRAASTTWSDGRVARQLAPLTISEHQICEIFDFGCVQAAQRPVRGACSIRSVKDR